MRRDLPLQLSFVGLLQDLFKEFGGCKPGLDQIASLQQRFQRGMQYLQGIGSFFQPLSGFEFACLRLFL